MNDWDNRSTLGRKTSITNRSAVANLSAERFRDVDLIGFGEGIFERVDVVEVRDLIGFRLLHFATFDQLEYDASEIIGGMESPMSKHDWSHWAVKPESENSNSFQQLATGNVMRIVNACPD